MTLNIFKADMKDFETLQNLNSKLFNLELDDFKNKIINLMKVDKKVPTEISSFISKFYEN